ncbi:MAG TPA: S8 family serine peptidase [Desulfitobacteriaceae bacterium]|nr:S8 family serine peptidase [Desulfitobacteriaceae bacterium]
MRQGVSTAPNNKYVFISGTSAAVPFVTGIAALIRSMDNNICSEDIAKSILKNVTPIKSLEGKVKSNGIANAYESIKNHKK